MKNPKMTTVIKVAQMDRIKDALKLVKQIKKEYPYMKIHIEVSIGNNQPKYPLAVIEHGMSERTCNNLIKASSH